VAGFAAGGEEAPGAGSSATWGAFWSGAGEDSLGGSPAEELVQAMRAPRSKVGPVPRVLGLSLKHLSSI
jgi:hypothetical protein